MLGKKIGMTQVFDKAGLMKAVTVIEVGPCVVLEKKENVGTAGELRVSIGYSQEKKEKKQKRPQIGWFKKINKPHFKHVRETKVIGKEVPKEGTEIGVDNFKEDEKVNISSFSKGRGFQGGMRRHNWGGQIKTHGSNIHRQIGAVSASADPARIVKGRSMPGQMGNKKVTVRNLQIVKIDKNLNLLFVSGSCAGPTNSLVEINKSE